jgi:hypothetical protein
MWYIGQKKSLWLQIKENAGQYCDVPPNLIFILTYVLYNIIINIG